MVKHKLKRTIAPILLFALSLTAQGQGLLGYEPYNNKNSTSHRQTTYTVRLMGYTYNVTNENLIKVPIKVQIIEGKNEDYYKFIAYKADFYGWSQNFIGTPIIYSVSKRDDLYEYFDYCVTTPIGKIYFNIE